jgi:hypothetical protein
MWFAFSFVFPADKFCGCLSTTLSLNPSPVEGEGSKPHFLNFLIVQMREVKLLSIDAQLIMAHR